MAFRRLAFAASLGVASAQLIAEAPVDFAELQKTLQEELQASSKVEAPKILEPKLCDTGVKSYSGYLDVALGSQYFFWMFESRSNPSKDPLVLWLTGGPGCSSQLALLAENGPCFMSKNGTGTEVNPYSWTSQANVIWVDQPSATGFSTGLPLVTGEDGVAKNMYNFLQEFYKALPQYKNNDFYIFGESYAGHYVPAVSHYVWQQGKGSGTDFKVPLKGIGIGNGLTDPEEQYKWYPTMAFDGGKAEGGTLAKGVITGTLEHAAMQAATIPCVNQIKACNNGDVNSCTTAYAVCNYGELIPYQLSGYNPYDMRIKCAVPPLCYDFSKVETYLNDKSTQAQLGVSKTWGSCNRIVNMAFQHDWMKNFHTLIPDMLADNLKVLIYAGDVDYICNWLGNKKWALAMEWPHSTDFGSAEDKPYMVNGNVAGRIRASNGFHFMQVHQAGHMVPMDQPAVALQMLNDFLQGKLGTEPVMVV